MKMDIKVYYKETEETFKQLGGEAVDKTHSMYYFYKDELIAVIFKTDEFYLRASDVLDTAIKMIEKFKI